MQLATSSKQQYVLHPILIDFFFLFAIDRRPNLLFIIMNDPLINIDIDVNHFNNIYPDLNGNQSSAYYDCLKFNKLTFNCFTNLLNKKLTC